MMHFFVVPLAVLMVVGVLTYPVHAVVQNTYTNPETIPDMIRALWNSWFNPEIIHGQELGLGADDHPQYLNLDGRSGVQILTGGLTATGNLNSTNLYTNFVNSTVAIGSSAGRSLISNNYTSCIGEYSCGDYVPSKYQTSVGYASGYRNIGEYLTSIGSNSANQNVGNFDIFVGYASGYQDKGTYGIGVGINSARNNSGNNVTGIGLNSLRNNIGSDVVAIGVESGRDNVIQSKFLLKQNTVNSKPLISGNFASGQIAIDNYAAGTVMTDANGNLYVISDEKTKTDIKPFSRGLAAITQINPISYHFSKESGLDTQYEYSGVSAQNVRTAIPEAVFEKQDVNYVRILKEKGEAEIDNIYETIEVPRLDKDGKQTTTLSISDRAIIAVLINSVKEQQKQIEELQVRCK